jgi:16S rRNA (guanine966-N2)-methyltransferase
MFNALVSLGAVADAVVVDLFAGTGALGIEALSRGAAHCTFVDSDRAAITAVHANLASTGLAARATVLARDWTSALAVVDPGCTLALVDPPYDFAGWDDLLERLPAPLAVLESGHAVDPGPGWEMVREKRYGTTVVTIARRRPASTLR